ncbi:MAG: glycosyltransferase [Pirellulales bacterium]
MHILYVHRNFPAQFGHIAARLIEERGWQCTFASERPGGNPGGIRLLQYKIDERNKDGVHPIAQPFDEYGRHCLAVLKKLKAHREVQPDLIVGHCGFGSTALLRELYDCPIINFFEYYYHRHGSDIDFRPEFPSTDIGNLRCRLRNAGVLVDLQNCDAGYSPTQWQRSRFPAEYQEKIETVFDGIDADFWFRRPLAPGKPRWVWGRKLPAETKVVTYVSRGFESIRGFDIFMKVAKRLCEMRSDVLFVCVGTDEIHYGPDKRFTLGKSFREHVLAQDSYDLSRFIFTGRVSREELARIFSVSDLHVYLTVPFVLSWSFMNALACGCTVLGSATPPVQEMIQHEENGLLADFYDVDRFVELANKVLDDPQAYRPLGEAAVRMIEEKYSLDVCLPKMIDLYERTIAGYARCGFPTEPGRPSAAADAEARHTECADYDGVGAGAESNGHAAARLPLFTFSEVDSVSGPADDARGGASGAVRSQAEPGNESNVPVRFESVRRNRKAVGKRGPARQAGPTGEAIRVLFAIPHAFGRDPSKPYHSFNGSASERIEALSGCLRLLHQTFGSEQREASLIRTAFAASNTALAHEIDVVVCTSGQRHLLRELDVPSTYFHHEPRQCEPIMLGFECHALLRDSVGRYDYFCYLEDDLLIHDPWFFAKQRFFNLRAGNECVLQPNRFEVEHGARSDLGGPAAAAALSHPTTRRTLPIDRNGETDAWASRTQPTLHAARKTYIDGDLDERLVRKYQNIDEQPELALISMGVPIPCRRTLNPHCGGFFLNAEQMEHWSRQPHFLDKDCSFFSPIESANTFGIMRTFKIYKPAPSVANFLEIEHFGTSMLERLRQRDRKPGRTLVSAR